LVWPVGVVLDAERVHRGLDRLQVRPHLHVAEQFPFQGLVEPLHLSCRGGAAGLGVTGHDAVLPADPFEHHLGWAGLVEAAGELLAVVREYLVGDAEPLQRLDERQADGAAGGPAHYGGDDAEPGMVVHPGDYLGFATVGQPDAADDVHLPQFHRHFPLPPHVVLAPATPGYGLDEPVSHQHPVDGGQTGDRAGAAVAAELEVQPPLTPPGMVAA
jgi:hypothetical protein